MPEPLYVPVLPLRSHAATAFAGIPAVVRARAAPLWTLPPQEGGTLRQLPERVLQAVAGALGPSAGAWLDVPFAEDASGPARARLRDLWTWGAFTAVTAPDRPLLLRELAVESACSPFGSGRIGIRVAVPGCWDDARVDEVAALVAEIARTAEHGGTPVALDLLLDLGTVLEDRTEAGKEALLALDALVPLAGWRCVVAVSGASAKQPISDLPIGGYDHGSRHDWALWHGIRGAGREYGTRVRYGDYGALPAADVARPDRKNGGPAPWASIRYTTERDFLYTKFLPSGEGHLDSKSAAARSILRCPDYRGSADGWSHTWLQACAAGANGGGNAETWNGVSNHQHFMHVIRALTR